ncbi:MAG: hypothetical protein SynsKO_31660 [Synoicihabitans sp.]
MALLASALTSTAQPQIHWLDELTSAGHGQIQSIANNGDMVGNGAGFPDAPSFLRRHGSGAVTLGAPSGSSILFAIDTAGVSLGGQQGDAALWYDGVTEWGGLADDGTTLNAPGFSVVNDFSFDGSLAVGGGIEGPGRGASSIKWLRSNTDSLTADRQWTIVHPAVAVSGNGLVGTHPGNKNGDPIAHAWVYGDSPQSMGLLGGSGSRSDPVDINHDGTFAIGHASTTTPGEQVLFTWTPPQVISALPFWQVTSTYSTAAGMSGDGRFIIASEVVEDVGGVAVIYENIQPDSLENFLRNRGVEGDLGDRLVSAHAISADGRFIGGIGLIDGESRHFLVDMGPAYHPVFKQIFAGEGESVTLESGYTGTESIQWFFEGTKVTGASSVDLELTDVAFDDTGDYTFAVWSDETGWNFSSSTTVHVGAADTAAFPAYSQRHPQGLAVGNLNAVLFDGSKFIATGRGRNFATSLDGVTWTSQTGSPMNYPARGGLMFDGTRYVMVGDANNSIHSSDLVNWTIGGQTSPNTWIEGATYVASSSTMLGVGADGLIVTSGDGGDSWQTRDSGTSEPLRAVAGADAGYVVVGGNGTVLHSSDLVTWSVATIPTEAQGAWFNNVRFSNGKFFAMANRLLMESTDGLSWSLVTTEFSPHVNSDPRDIAWDGTHFTVALIDSRVVQSSDLVTWEILDLGFEHPEGTPLFALATDNSGNVVGVGPGGAIVHNTRNVGAVGALWDLFNVEYIDGKFWATGANGVLLTSSDGTNWEERPNGRTGHWFKAIIKANGRYVMPTGSGAIRWSDDGVVWNEVSSNTIGDTRDNSAIAFANGEFLVTTTEGHVRRSADATSWNTTLVDAQGTPLNGIASIGGTVVAVGDNGLILTSKDNQNWQEVDLGHDWRWFRVRALDGLFVAMGQNNQLAISTDGLNWRSHDVQNIGWEITDIARGPDGYYVSSGGPIGQIGRTTNFRDWNLLTQVVTGDVRAMSIAGGELVFVAEGGLVGDAEVQDSTGVVQFLDAPSSVIRLEEGEGLDLGVYVRGASPISYQWQLDGVDIEGAEAARLYIASASVSDIGFYSVTVTTGDGLTASREFRLADRGTVTRHPHIYWLDDFEIPVNSFTGVANNGDLIGLQSGNQSTPGFVRRFATGEVTVGFPSGTNRPYAIDSAGVAIGGGRGDNYATWWDGEQQWGGINADGFAISPQDTVIYDISYDGTTAAGGDRRSTGHPEKGAALFGKSNDGESLFMYSFETDREEQSAISGDGKVFVFYDAQGVVFRRFMETGVRETLASFTSRDFEAVDTNFDGSSIIGHAFTTPDEQVTQVFRWTENGEEEFLPRWDSNQTHSRAIGISGDGRLIVANEGTSAIIFEDGIPQRLDDYLTERGVTGGIDTLTDVHAISPDGRFIVGWGRVGTRTAFLVDMGAAYTPVYENIYAQVGEGVAIPSGLEQGTELKWYHNGDELTGHTDNVLILPDVSLDDAGEYTFSLWSDIDGRRFSSPANVHVGEVGATPLPNFGQRHPVAGSPGGLVDVIFDGSRYVAYGRGGRVMTSTDGQTWNQEASSPFDFPQSGSMTFTGSEYIMVGHRPAAYRSTDLSSWTEIGAFEQGSKHAVTWFGSTLVAVGDNGSIERSVDRGATWEVVESGTTSSLHAIIANSGGYAISPDGTVLHSPGSNGLDWSPLTLPEGYRDRELIGMGAINSPSHSTWFVGRDTVLRFDGTTWDVIETGFSGTFSAAEFTDRITITSWEGDVMHAQPDDLTSWERSAIPAINPGASLLGLAVGASHGNFGRHVVAVGNGGARYFSEDSGARWTNVGATGATNVLNDIVVRHGQFQVVGGNGVILSSPDGRNWFQKPRFTGHWLTGTAEANGVTLLPSDWGRILRSENGGAWQEIDPGDHVANRGYTTANGEFVLVGDNGLVRRSTDGANWNTAQIPGVSENLRAAASLNGTVVAVGDAGGVFTSTDNINWTTYPTVPNHAWQNVRVVDGVFFATGDSSQLWVSHDGFDWYDLSDVRLGWGINDIVKGPDGYYFPSGSARTHINKTANFDQIDFVGQIDAVDLRRAAVHNDVMVLVGEGGAIYSSDLPAVSETPMILEGSAPETSATQGADTLLQVFATGAEPLAYRWSKDGQDLPGAVGAMLVLKDVQPEDEGIYRVTVSNANGDTSSLDTRVSLPNPPTFTEQPTAASLNVGSALQMSVAATSVGGGDVSYQWRRNGAPIPGATSAVFEIAAVSLSDAGFYDVLATGGSTATSESVRVDVFPSERPTSFHDDPDWNLPLERDGATIRDIVTNPGGGFYVVGDFLSWDGHATRGIVKLNTDGSVDTSFTSEIVGSLEAVGIAPDGKPVATGGARFGGPTGQLRGTLRFNLDGSVDTSFDSEYDEGGSAIAVAPDGSVFVSGTFEVDEINHVTRGLVRLTATGSRDPVYDPDIRTEDGGLPFVRSIIAVSGTEIYVALDSPSRVNGIAVPRVVKLFASIGVPDTSFDAGFPVDSGPLDMALDSAGDIWIAAGLAVIKVGTDGTQKALLSTYHGTAFSVAVGPDDSVVVTGDHGPDESNIDRKGFSKYASDGTLIDSFTATADARVWEVAVGTDGAVLVGGEFNAISGTAIQSVAKLSSAGALDDAYRPALASDGVIHVITPMGDGSYLLGGNFSRIGGLALPNLVRILADGAIDADYMGSGAPNAAVQFVEPAGDGFMLAGPFNDYNGSGTPNFIRINADGTRDENHNITYPHWGPGGSLLTELFVDGDGASLSSGWFWSPDVSKRLVRNFADGSYDEDFDLLSDNVAGAFSPFFVILHGPGSSLYGGGFQTSGAGTSFYKFDESGMIDETFLANIPALSHTGGAVFAGDDLFVSAYPSEVGGPSLFRLDYDGNVDTAFAPPVIQWGWVGQGPHSYLFPESDGSLIVGGNFNIELDQDTIIERPTLARFNADGTLDENLRYAGSRRSISAMHQLDDGNFLIGFHGRLTRTMGDLPVIIEQPEPQQVGVGDDLTLTISVETEPNLTYQWMRNGHPIPGADQSTLELSNLRVADAGFYRVKVTGAGSIDSDEVRVDVFHEPIEGALVSDPNFNAVFEKSGGMFRSIESLSDGGFIAGGDFVEVGGHRTQNVARINSDGSVDATFTAEFMSGVVHGVAVQSDGKIIVVGSFQVETSSGKYQNITRLLPNGSVDDTFIHPEAGVLYGVDLGADDSIYAAGLGVNKYSPNGIRDQNFAPSILASSGEPAWVILLKVLPDGGVLGHGSGVKSVDGVDRHRLFKLTSSGELDSTFYSPLMEEGPSGNGVRHIKVDSADRIWLSGGLRSEIEGANVRVVARLAPDGANDLLVTINTNPGGIGVLADDSVVVLGRLLSANGVEIDGSFKISADGAQIESLDYEVEGFRVEAAVSSSMGSVLLGGLIDSVNGVAVEGVALLDSNLSPDTTFDPSPFRLAKPSGIHLLSDGGLLVGGDFEMVNGMPHPNLVKLNGDGSVDQSYDLGAGMDGFVTRIEPTLEGKIWVNGSFQEIAGDSHPNLIRLLADGSIDPTFMLDSRISGFDSARTLAPLADGGIIISGTGTDTELQTTIGFIRLDESGRIDRTFVGQETFTEGFARPHYGTIQGPDDSLVTNIRFSVGDDLSSVEMIDSEGTLISEFDFPVEYGSTDGIGGVSGESFYSATSRDGRNSIQRVGFDGSIGDGFDAPSIVVYWPINRPLIEFYPEADGGVILGGAFDLGVSDVEQLSQPILARLRSDGSWDPNLSVPDIAGSEVTSILRVADGSFYSGATGRLHRLIPLESRITDQPTDVQAEIGDQLQLEVGVSDVESLTFQWFKDGRAIEGANNAVLNLETTSRAGSGFYHVAVSGLVTETSDQVRVDIYPPVLEGLLAADEEWTVALEKSGADVTAFAATADGGAYLGGSFVEIDDHRTTGVAKIKADGSVDTTFEVSFRKVVSVTEVVTLDSGKLLVVGIFDVSVGGETWTDLVRLNDDGSVDTSFLGGRDNAYKLNVDDIAATADEAIYFGGSYEIDDQTYPLGRLKPTGELDLEFTPSLLKGDDTLGWVRDITILGPDRVAIVGNFEKVSGVSQSAYAVLDSEGNLDTTASIAFSNAGENLVGTAIRRTPTGDVLLALTGLTSEANDSRAVVLRLSGAGGAPQIGTEIPGVFIYGVLPDGGDGAYIIGDGLNNALTNGLILTHMDSTLTLDQTVAVVGDAGALYATRLTNGDILLSGGFGTINSENVSVVAKVSATGDLDSTFAPSFLQSAEAFGLEVQADGRTVLGGDFEFVNGVPSAYLARINTDGSVDSSFASGGGPNDQVLSVLQRNDGRLYILGYFTQYGGVSTGDGNIARLHADGSLDESFSLSKGTLLNPSSTVSAQLASDGGLWISGWYFDSAISSNNSPAKVSPDGTIDSQTRLSRDNEVGGGGIVNAIVASPDAGYFFGGWPSRLFGDRPLARVDDDLTVDIEFRDPFPDQDYVGDLQGVSNGIYATTLRGFHRLTWDGELDEAFSAPDFGSFFSRQGPIANIYPQRDGSVLVAGGFTTTDPDTGSNRQLVARFEADGKLDEDLALFYPLLQIVSSVTQGPDGNLVLGLWGEVIRTMPYVASSPEVIDINADTVLEEGDELVLSVNATGDGPLTYQWKKDGEDLLGATLPQLDLGEVSLADAGTYTVVVTNAVGSVTSDPIIVEVTTVEPLQRSLLSVSSRLELEGGAKTYVPFRIEGDETKFVLVRAVGPTLGDFGVSDVMADPRLRVLDSTGTEIAANDNWDSDTNNAAAVTSANRTAGAFGLNAGSLDAATLVLLQSGNYILEVTGDTSGAVIVELMDAHEQSTTTRLMHAGVGAHFEGSSAMIVGFTLAPNGTDTRDFLIRAVGPGLTVPGSIADPRFQLFQQVDSLAENDDWDNTGSLAADFVAVGAPGFDVGSADAALSRDMLGGAYTSQIRAATGNMGAVLFEIYDAGDAEPSLIPFVLIPPFEDEATVGELVEIGVYAGGEAPLSYQWQRNGSNIPGATSPLLSIPSATLGDTAEYRVVVSNSRGSITTAAASITVTPAAVAPAITTQPSSVSVFSGDRATFTVVATGTAPLSYQWYEGLSSDTTVPVSGATSPSLITDALSTSTSYWVQVSNGQGSVDSETATATVLPPSTTMASHSVLDGGYVAGDTVTIRSTFTYDGTASAIGWKTTLPDGWSYASTGGAQAPTITPLAGTTGILEWAYFSPAASGSSFEYTVNVPEGTTGTQTLTAVLLFRDGVQPEETVVASPASLNIDPRPSLHSADVNGDNRLSLSELLRVIEIYNTRFGTTRTGRYGLSGGTEDGFTPNATIGGSEQVTLSRYHSADSNEDAKISLSELLRVIEIYNTRSGTTRTGEYHLDPSTEDGFAPGPG